MKDCVTMPAIRPQVDLFAERHEVRETAKRNLYTGKTYNSVENIQQFFAERGVKVPSMSPQQPQPQPRSAASCCKRLPQGPLFSVHKPRLGKSLSRLAPRFGIPKYGRGTVLRREGDGEDAKLTVSFPGYGLKKLVEKYAGIKEE